MAGLAGKALLMLVEHVFITNALREDAFTSELDKRYPGEDYRNLQLSGEEI
jgi:hypothetical protein